jgi:hypothetical protein
MKNAHKIRKNSKYVKKNENSDNAMENMQRK